MSDYMQAVQSVFPKQVCRRIESAVQQHGNHQELALLFYDIAYLTQQASSGSNSAAPAAAKKRKLEDGGAAHTNGTAAFAQISNPETIFECKDVSVQLPARKKLKLQLVRDAHDGQRQEVRLRDQNTNECEHSLSAEQIEHAFCLAVPEKTQRQCNFILLPKPDAVKADGSLCEQVLYTLNEGPPKGAVTAEQKVEEGETFVTLMEQSLNAALAHYGKKITRPSEKEFASAIPQSHRKGEKAWHIKAHRGSKEGYLWLLSTGILFGFKKPISFFPFASVDSISYTSVLQRTFNLVISVRDENPADTEDEVETKEIEFSMLDQMDFAGIDDYIKRHGLNDASMAAQRRAKAYNVNKEKKGDVEGGGEEESELQKAEQQLQDEEDEEEEDYVASGGESEGEGEDSEEEEDDGDGGGDGGSENGEDDEDDEVSAEE